MKKSNITLIVDILSALALAMIPYISRSIKDSFCMDEEEC